MAHLPEKPIIRPPSEWRSLLVRITRGCRWNRCRFCGIYPALGEPEFSVRPIDDIKADIDTLSAMHPCPETAFFGDADPLTGGIDLFSEAARHLWQALPGLRRLTCYARASTLWKTGREGIARLAHEGLNRVHMGLESGSATVLNFHRKGQSPEMVQAVTEWLSSSGIETSFYVLLGLGGSDNWEEHIRGTAAVINATAPDFVRIRRLWLYTQKDAGQESPLWKMVREGKFHPQSPEGTVREMELLVELLESSPTFLICDHANNFINVSGRLDENRKEMLTEIREFLALPQQVKNEHYRATGSRI